MGIQLSNSFSYPPMNVVTLFCLFFLHLVAHAGLRCSSKNEVCGASHDDNYGCCGPETCERQATWLPYRCRGKLGTGRVGRRLEAADSPITQVVMTAGDEQGARSRERSTHMHARNLIWTSKWNHSGLSLFPSPFLSLHPLNGGERRGEGEALGAVLFYPPYLKKVGFLSR